MSGKIRLIDAERLRGKLIEGDGDDEFTEGYNAAINDVKEYIDNMSTIEAENKTRGENNMTIEEIKKKITEQENILQELKKELEKVKENENKIPDDVKDIPQVYDFDDYTKVARYLHRGWLVNEESKVVQTDIDRAGLQGNMIFPEKEFAEMFREKAQHIVDCIFFKWYYDREYVPIWDGYNDNYCVVYQRSEKRYNIGCYNNLRHDTAVYFSTKEIAEKCAEWLNYKYFGIYNPKEGENNDKE